MAIKNKAIKLHKKYVGGRIKCASLVNDTPVILFTEAARDTFVETTLPCTPEVYARVKIGDSYHPDLANGLIRSSRFNTIVYSELIDDVETVTAVHAYPIVQFTQCDMAQEMNVKCPKDSILIIVKDDTGEMEMVVFPSNPKLNAKVIMPDVIMYLTRLEEIKVGLTFKKSNATCKVVRASESEILINCKVDPSHLVVK